MDSEDLRACFEKWDGEAGACVGANWAGVAPDAAGEEGKSKSSTIRSSSSVASIDSSPLADGLARLLLRPRPKSVRSQLVVWVGVRATGVHAPLRRPFMLGEVASG